jgi:hypothetical protein
LKNFPNASPSNLPAFVAHYGGGIKSARFKPKIKLPMIAELGKQGGGLKRKGNENENDGRRGNFINNNEKGNSP